MTKAEANRIKKKVNAIPKTYNVYYSSKREELSIRAYEYTDEFGRDPEFEKKRISGIMELLRDEPYTTEIRRLRYQGFINDVNVVVK